MNVDMVEGPEGMLFGPPAIESKVKKNEQRIESLRADLLRLNNRIDALERTIRDMASKNMELQGRVTTLAGRIRGGER